MKWLVVGDIHGCFAELQDLLGKAGLADGDEIIGAGDIVDRGPDSPKVLDFFRSHPAIRAVMGNHERKHLGWSKGIINPAISQRITRKQLGEDRYPDALAFMASLPLWLELPDALVLHGFLEPGIPLDAQLDKVLVGTLTGERRLTKTYPRPWYEYYQGPKPLVVGHRNYTASPRPFIHQDLVFGIDTSCCRGGALTGLLLPDFRILSVPARDNHWRETLAQNQDLAIHQSPPSQAPGRRKAESSALECSGQDPWDSEEAERAIRALLERVETESAAILAALRAECPYDTLTSREQGKAYAAKVGKSPLGPYLHMARKGQLDLEAMRRLLRSPERAIELAEPTRMPAVTGHEDE